MAAEKTIKIYEMRMRVVRGAPHYDSVDAGVERVEATNAWDAEAVASRRVKARYEGCRSVYATSRKRVKS